MPSTFSCSPPFAEKELTVTKLWANVNKPTLRLLRLSIAECFNKEAVAVWDRDRSKEKKK